MVCGTKEPKRDLVRIVATDNGTAEVDTAGKMQGRGAYVCQKDVLDAQVPERGRLSYALRASITDENWHALVRAIGETAEGQ